MTMETFAVMPGFNFWLGIADADHRVIGNDVLDGDRRIADLHDFALERPRRKRVDGEIHVLIDRDPAHVRFGHVRVDLHFREIICDRENNRRLQTGGHRLAHIDISRNHDAIDRRRDRAVVQVGFRFLEARLP